MDKKFKDLNFKDIDWPKYQDEIKELRNLWEEIDKDDDINKMLMKYKAYTGFTKDKKTAQDVWNWLDFINDRDNMCYFDCKENFGTEWYEAILKKVKEYNPKRVVDIGSNLNQYGYLFENEGIEYIGIDDDTTIPCKYGFMQPYISDKVKFIQAKYEDVADYFKDDIIISCLCVGYLVKIESVKAKHLIINGINDKDDCYAKVVF